ncbi:hypothetical protein BJV82DRAFT_519531 [Fennellomyces sp. T-0311]|nr:hypothetical protein BJV82DRAFT_519531 [Fennellomyces sp. T-0311]
MQIRILGIPESGAKSRVETQIKLCVQLLTSQGTKVPQWSFVRLPEFMLARSKLRKTQQRKQLANKLGVVDCDESKVLSLSATVFCVSDPERKLRMCAGCRKRAERKKDSHLTEEALLSAMSDDAFEKERDRILLFNCEPLVNFSSGDAILPTRITCYCRHHNERVGFRIRFALQDCSGTTVASGETPPIMITDDHKSTKQGPVAGRKRRRTEYALATPASSRRNSLCIDGDETSTQYQPSLFHQPFMDDQYSLESSPLPTPAEEQTSSVFGNDNTAAPWCVIPERPLPSTIENNLGLTTAAVSSSQQVAMLHQEHPNPLTTMIPNMNITTPVTTPIDSPSSYAPRVDRLVPNNGPVYGGCEITILGANFRTGLTCLFGDRPAITLCWSPSTLVCVLPASTHPGPVVVSFKEHPLVVDGNDITLFTYYDTSDHALMELALQVQQTVVGHTNTEQRVMNALEAVQVDDVSIINAQGHSLLHLAVLCGYRRLVHLLMSNGTSNIHAQDRTGMSALQMALWKGDGQVTEMLLQRTPLSTSASCLSLSDRARPSSLRRFHSFQHTASKVQGSDMDENGLGFAKQKHDQRLYAFWLPLLLGNTVL